MALNSMLGSFRATILPKISFLANQKININLLATQTFPKMIKSFQTSSTRNDLMEFFDDKKNWSETEIQVGRSWKLDELRIKSNTDLHKLWYVLLKERNMLMTMEHECKEMIRLFPNPERIDKVEESMKCLETVVRERNVAYHMLETGLTGERSARKKTNQLGLWTRYKSKEHLRPRSAFGDVPKPGMPTYGGYAVRKFLRLYKEQLSKECRKKRNSQENHVKQLLKRFPEMDMEKLKEAYPNVDIDKLKCSKMTHGHFVKIS